MQSSVSEIPIERVRGTASIPATDVLAVEQPLEIQLGYGPPGDRNVKSIAVTIRTPGHDLELAVGFLVTEGVIRDPVDIVGNPAQLITEQVDSKRSVRVGLGSFRMFA
jgi:FdhD protein